MQHRLVSVITLIGSLLLAGCATTPPSRSGRTGEFELHLTHAGQLLFDGKSLSIDQLGKRLHAAGATPDSSIVVDIPADIPRERIAAITSRLLSSGYRKVMLKRPRHTEVSVTPASSSPVSPVPEPH